MSLGGKGSGLLDLFGAMGWEVCNIEQVGGDFFDFFKIVRHTVVLKQLPGHQRNIVNESDHVRTHWF